MTTTFQREIDVRGLKCPIPLLKTKKTLMDMLAGEILLVKATDKGSIRDFQAFSKQTGNTLLEYTEKDGTFTFFMKRKL